MLKGKEGREGAGTKKVFNDESRTPVTLSPLVWACTARPSGMNSLLVSFGGGMRWETRGHLKVAATKARGWQNKNIVIDRRVSWLARITDGDTTHFSELRY